VAIGRKKLALQRRVRYLEETRKKGKLKESYIGVKKSDCE